MHFSFSFLCSDPVLSSDYMYIYFIVSTSIYCSQICF